MLMTPQARQTLPSQLSLHIESLGKQSQCLILEGSTGDQRSHGQALSPDPSLSLTPLRNVHLLPSSQPCSQN